MKSILKSVGNGICLFLGVGRNERVSFLNAEGVRERGVVLKRISGKHLRVRGDTSGRVKLDIKKDQVVFE